MAVNVDLFLDNKLGRFRQYYDLAERRMEAAALIASDRAARVAKTQLRGDMRRARLGRLGQAIGSTSDLEKNNRVYRRGEGFSASGIVFARSRSPRTIGALNAYTQGAQISPVKSRYMWIPTDDIPRISQRQRLTPALWRKNGLDKRIGPLVEIKSVDGDPLLVVQNVGVNAAGRRRSARSLTLSGRPRKGQIQRSLVVAFIGIPRTSRKARINVKALMRKVQQQIPQYLSDAIERTRR